MRVHLAGARPDVRARPLHPLNPDYSSEVCPEHFHIQRPSATSLRLLLVAVVLTKLRWIVSPQEDLFTPRRASARGPARPGRDARRKPTRHATRVASARGTAGS